MSDKYLLQEAELKDYCRGVLMECDLSADDLEIMVETTVLADLRGVSSHGIARLHNYAERMKTGLINPRPAMRFEEKSDSLYLLEADNGPGQVAAARAMRLAVEKAREKGICCVGIRNTNHIGLAGYYPEIAAAQGMAGLITANTNPAMAPFGGVKALLGTNPFALAVPTKKHPILLDMATTNVARGKIRVFEKEKRHIPLGWAKDCTGCDTTDPTLALEGTCAPVGGPKGYGMALLIDILAGILTGSGSSDEVSSLDDMSRPIRSGNLLFALNIGAMLDYNLYLERVEGLRVKIKESPRADDIEEILLAGELEYSREEANRAQGLAVSAELWQNVRKMLGS